jgi:ABC-type Fe3+-hydroxamate transport system substrate-binding protein
MSYGTNRSRRRFLTGVGGLIGTAALGACGAAPQMAAPAAPTLATADYPRTIQDKFGAVEITAKPQRIMNFYGNAGLDALLALGVMPALIATYDGFTLLPWQSAARDVPFLLMANGVPNQEKVFAEGIDLVITAEYPTATKAARDERAAHNRRPGTWVGRACCYKGCRGHAVVRRVSAATHAHKR